MTFSAFSTKSEHVMKTDFGLAKCDSQQQLNFNVTFVQAESNCVTFHSIFLKEVDYLLGRYQLLISLFVLQSEQWDEMLAPSKVASRLIGSAPDAPESGLQFKKS